MSIKCFVCGDECNFDEASFTIDGKDVKSINQSSDKTFRLCQKCMRLLYLSYAINNRLFEGRYTYPDGVFVEEEETINE